MGACHRLQVYRMPVGHPQSLTRRLIDMLEEAWDSTGDIRDVDHTSCYPRYACRGVRSPRAWCGRIVL